MKLFDRKRWVIMIAAVVGGLGAGGYQISQQRGGLDPVGVISLTVTALLIGGVLALVVRHGNKSE
jgi:hypothetical protein